MNYSMIGWVALAIVGGWVVYWTFLRWQEYKIAGDENRRKMLMSDLVLLEQYANLAVRAAKQMPDLETNEDKLTFAIDFLRGGLDLFMDAVPVPEDLRPIVEGAYEQLKAERHTPQPEIIFTGEQAFAETFEQPEELPL